MKKLINVLVLCLMLLSVTSCAYERVDAGYEGIKVNLYGDSKGVDDVELVTGAVWYNPFTTAVYEYPTFIQTVNYPAFEVNSKDGTRFIIDPSALIKIKDGNASNIFVKYRKPLEEVIENTLYVYIQDAARIEFNKYNADEIVSNREAVDKSFELRVRESFIAENFILDQLSPGIKYPKSYEDAINQKNKAIQDQMRVQNEVAVAKAEAEKKIAKAQGDAQALKVQADAEAYYNRTVSNSLSTLIIQQNMLEKWDGQLPMMNGSNGVMLDVNKIIK